MKVTTLLLSVAVALTCFPISALSQDKPQTDTPSKQTSQNVIRIRVDGKEQAKLLIVKVRPVYPKEALKKRIQGTVRLQVIINIGVEAYQIALISGDPLLVPPAMDAVRQWRYRSTLRNGVPMEVDTTIDVIFALAE